PAITVYDDAPAINARLSGAILSIDGVPTRSIEELRLTIASKQPGQTIVVTTREGDANFDHSITLADRDGKAYLGIGINKPSRSGFKGIVSSVIFKIKDPYIYYAPTWGGEFAWFVYYLLWWVFMINLLVALFNMLPLGMLDGGRFFYLAVWGITGREVWGKRAFKIASWFFIALLALMMVRWFAIFF
ncbi:MAG: M50 family metallopeptidase, partial [Nanoarchaeota archaeon]